MAINYPNGAGQSTGDSLVTTFPLIASGQILYVNSATGDDAYDGTNEAKPFATWVAALTAASAHDIIVLMDGHAETMDPQSFSTDNVVTLGAGSAAGLPTAKIAFTGGGSDPGLTLSGYANQIRNVWFESYTESTDPPRIKWTGDHGKMVGCYFECGPFDNGAGLECDGNTFQIDTTTFISTAVLSTAQPAIGMVLGSVIGGEGGGEHACLRMNGCVFDGGSHGFSNPWALDDNGTEVVQLEVEALSLLRGADARLDGAGNTRGFVNPMVTTGGSNVRF